MTLDAATLASLQRAQSLLQAGQAGAAWSLVKPLRQGIDRHGQGLRLYALVAQQVGDAEAAIEALKRIVRLEGEPPELVGALADTLGRAGRHDESFDAWTRLVTLRPDLADAHLNRALAAMSAGKADDSLAAAEAGLARFPKDVRLLSARAAALKNAGRIAEAVKAFEVAVAADPSRIKTLHNYAVTLRAASRFEEACETFERAAELGAGGADFLSHWGAAALEAGAVEQAVGLYERALAEDPAHAESRKALTRIRHEYLDEADPFAHFARLTEQRGHSVAAYVDWTDALVGNSRPAEAAEVARAGLARHPGDPTLTVIEAFTAGMSGDAASGLAKLQQLRRQSGPDAMIDSSIRLLAVRAGEPTIAAPMLEAEVAANPYNQVAWSQLAIVWRLLGDPREEWLCDYERLVMVTEVTPPDELLDPAAYAAVVAAALDPLHVARHAPGDQTLRGGTQTSGNLFERPEPEITRFRLAVEEAARRALAALPDDPAHPFLSRKSDRFRFSGSWSVRLAGGGHHVPHYHSEGWMSSAYYARLPAATAAADERHEGWIQFGVPPEVYGLDLAPRRLVQPRPGRLVLFPSYLWHGTIPFEGGDRLTAAFDYQPV